LGDLSLICSSTLVALEGNFGEEGQTCGGGGHRNEKVKGPKWLEGVNSLIKNSTKH